MKKILLTAASLALLCACKSSHTVEERHLLTADSLATATRVVSLAERFDSIAAQLEIEADTVICNEEKIVAKGVKIKARKQQKTIQTAARDSLGTAEKKFSSKAEIKRAKEVRAPIFPMHPIILIILIIPIILLILWKLKK